MRKSFSTNNNGTTNFRPSPSLSLALVNIFQSVQSLLSPRPCDVAVTGPIIGPIMGGLSFLWIIREIPRQKLKTKWIPEPGPTGSTNRRGGATNQSFLGNKTDGRWGLGWAGGWWSRNYQNINHLGRTSFNSLRKKSGQVHTLHYRTISPSGIKKEQFTFLVFSLARVFIRNVHSYNHCLYGVRGVFIFNLNTLMLG